MKLPLVPALLMTLLLTACGDSGAPPADGGPIVAGGGPSSPVVRLTFEDPDGKPIGGVQVLARLPYGAGQAGLEGIRTLSDPSGVAIVDVEGKLAPSRDAPVHVTAKAVGFVPKTWQIPTYRPGLGMRITVRLDPAGAVTGRVSDSSGSPVAGAFVFLLRRGVPGFMREDETFSTHTNEEGAYRIDPAPTGLFHLGCHAEGYLPGAVSNVEVTPRNLTEVPLAVLAPGASISGRVTTPDGSAVAGARVRAWRLEDLADFRFFAPEMIDRAGGTTTTADDGTFRITGLAAAEYTVDAAALGYSVVDAQKAGVAAGADDVALVLEKGFPLTIAVRDVKTKEPIADFRVVLSELQGGEDLQGRPLMMDDKTIHSPMGQIALRLRPGARYRLEIGAEGYDILRVGVGPVGPDTPSVLPVDLVPRD